MSESFLQCSAPVSSQDLVQAEAPTIAQNFALSPEQISTESTSQSSSSNASKTQSIMTKSPGGATVRSLICPGWGQLYNESYWKSALFFGAAATVSGILLWNNSRYLDANTTYSTPGISALEKDQAYREREFYRDQRDVSGLWLLGIYALSAVDAYVGAHLFDFDVSDKGVSLLPVATPQSYALSAAWHF